MLKFTLLVLFALGCLALAHASKKNDKSCLYESTEGQLYEHLSEIGKFKNVKDQFGLFWEVKACARSTQSDAIAVISTEYLPVQINETNVLPDKEVGDDDDEADEVDDDEVKPKRVTVHGLSYKALWSDSSLGPSNGAEVIFGSLTQCNATTNTTYKTAIQFICTDDKKPLYSFFFYDCFTIITVNSSKACPMIPGDREFHSIMSIISLFGIVALAAFVCTCCCVTCHRIRQRRHVASTKKQFSNIAFQPIPSSQSVPNKVQIQQSPLYNPYIQTPQYFYYPAQATMFTSEALEVAVDVQYDERVARALQAKFDNENTM